MRAAATDAFERNRISTRRAASQFPSATQNVSAGAITQPRRRKPAFGGETCPALLASLGASTGRRAGTLDRTPRTGLRSRLGTLARSAKNDGRSTGKLSEARSCSSLGAPFAKREFAAGSNSPKWRRRHESEPATCRRSRTSASSSYRARPTPRVSSVPTPTTSASTASSSSTSTTLASTPTGLRRHLTSSSCDRGPCGATAWGPTPARGERAANFAPKDDDHEHGLGVRDDERSEHGQQFGQHHDDRGALMGNRDDSGLVGGHEAGPGK